MATRADGTQPMISHGSVYLRPGEREGCHVDVHRMAVLADEWRSRGAGTAGTAS